LARRFKAQEDWKAARKNPAEVMSAPDLRENAFTDITISVAATDAAAAAAGEAAAGAAAAPAPASSKPPAAAAPAPGSGGGKENETGAAAAGAAGAAAAAAAPKTVVSAESGVWNEEQELALVKALKQVRAACASRARLHTAA
jgi:hypothetical protein